MKGRKKSRRKVKMKRLAILLIIALAIIAITVGILNLIIKFISPEKVVGNSSNGGLVISDGKAIYYNKYETGIFEVKNKKEKQITNETAYSMTLVKDTIYYLTVSDSNTIDLKSVNINGPARRWWPLPRPPD